MTLWRFGLRLLVAIVFVAAGSATYAIANPTKFTIHIQDYVFRPVTLHIHPGDSVMYVNDDEDTHTVTADDKSFDSKNLEEKQQWTFVFAKPGRYTYHCSLHGYVHGEVDVDSP
jgi:plastocyanin